MAGNLSCYNPIISEESGVDWGGNSYPARGFYLSNRRRGKICEKKSILVYLGCENFSIVLSNPLIPSHAHV